MLEELETNEISDPTKNQNDEISDPTKNQNDEIIVDQLVVKSKTTQIEENPISLRVVVELLDNRIVIWEEML